MADDKAEVVLGARTQEANAALADFQSKLAATLSQAGSQLQQFGRKAQESNNAMVESFRGSVERVKTIIGALSAVLAGGFVFKEIIGSMLELEDSVRTLQITMGMGAAEATEYAARLKVAGVSADTFAMMAMKVGRQLRQPNNELERLGVVTKDASGNLLPMESILQNVFSRMQDFKAGTDQDLFAMSALGRGSKDFANDMLRINAAQEIATKTMHDFGLEMGPEKQAEIEQYRLQMGAFHLALDAIADKIGEAVLPQLMAMARYFNDTGPSAVKFFGDRITNLIVGFDMVATGVKELSIIIPNWADNTVTAVTSAARAVKALATDGWSAAVKIWEEGDRQIVISRKKAWAEVLGLEVDMTKRLGALREGFNAPKGGNGSPLGSGNAHFTPKPEKGDGDMAGWENVLNGLQDAYNKMKLDQGSFETWSTEQTRQYWQEVLQYTTLSGKDRLAAEDKYYAANRKLQLESFATYLESLEAQKAALGDNIAGKIALTETELAAVKQRYGEESKEAQAMYKALNDLQVAYNKQQRDLALDASRFRSAIDALGVESESAALQQQVALRQVTADQMYAMEQELENKVYQIKLRELQQSLQLDDLTLLQRQQINEQIETLEVQHQQKLTTIANQAELERKNYALQADKAVQDGFSNFLADAISGTKSLKNGFNDAVKSLTQGLNKIASDKIAQQLFGAGTQGGGMVDGLMQKIFGGAGLSAGGATGDAAHTAAVSADTAAVSAQTATTTALTTVTTLLQTGFDILATAAQSAAAALQSVSASSAGSSMGGGLASLFGDGLMSFDTGTPYVPNDTLAMVHKGEAVIPASMNRRGAGGGTAFTQHLTVNVSGAVDSRTLDQIAAATARGAQRATRSIM